MMRDDLARVDDWYDVGEPEESGQGVNPLLVMHRCLRGRYLLAAVLAAVLAIPCGIAGYLAVAPKYTSIGSVNIKPSRNYVLYRDEEAMSLSAFDGYVKSQANLLRSRRIVNLAVGDPELRSSGWPQGSSGVVELERSLSVTAGSREQDIFVAVTHDNQSSARAAVNAILRAYEMVAIDESKAEYEVQLSKLEDLRTGFLNAANEKRQVAVDIAREEGTDDLARRRDAKHAQWARLDEQIDQYKLDLVPFGDLGLDEAADRAQDSPSVPPGDSIEELAQRDPELGRLVAERESSRVQLDSLRQRFGPSHRAVLAAEQDLEVAQTLVNARAALLRALPDDGLDPLPESSVVQAARILRAQIARLEQTRDRVSDEAKRLGQQQIAIEQAREAAARDEEQWRLADARYRALETELKMDAMGRITISEGSMPFRPSTDRRLALAAIGGIGGGGAGIGLVTLLGFLLPKYRYIDDLGATNSNVFVYGAVPELDAADSHSRELVAASVAQVRSVIDARQLGTADRALIHLVTSAGASEGKSTISLRLAKSFAATGRKTLLVDADLIGQRLSAEFGLRGRSGFADCVVGRGSTDTTVHETDVPDLYLMPCGNTDHIDPEQVSARRVDGLLAMQRDVYQAIVVDTGPVLGSLEAQAVAAIADEVMLVVTRGRDVRHVRMAIDRLRRLGAHKVGVVFNRASPADVERSTSLSVTSQRTAEVRSKWQSNGHHGAENAARPAVGSVEDEA